MTAATNRSYAGGHFELILDGFKHSAYVKSFEGGSFDFNIVQDVASNMLERGKHIGQHEIKDFSVELGLSGMGGLLRWIKQAWNNDAQPVNGEIVHSNFNLGSEVSQSFTNAWIKEIQFPACGDGKDMYLKLTLSAEAGDLDFRASGQKAKGESPAQQKLWTTSGYRLLIDGIGDCTKYVSKIDAFGVKIGQAVLETGEMFGKQFEPCAFTFPELKGTVSLAHAKPFSDWLKETKTKSDLASQKTGSLEYLAPNRQDVLFAVQLYGIGLKSFGIDNSKANQDSIKRAKFELHVKQMSFSTSGAGIAG